MSDKSPISIVQRLSNAYFLAIVVAIIGSLLLILSILSESAPRALNSVALVTASLIFFAVEIAGSKGKPSQISGKIVLVIYFGIIALLIFLYSVNQSREPVVVYLTVIAYTLVAINILRLQGARHNLVLIFLTGIINRATGYYSSALFVGTDIYRHYAWAQMVLSEGSINALIGTKYYYTPAFHLLSSATAELLRISIPNAVVLTTLLLITIVPGSVIYVITAKYWQREVALFSTLIYVMADEPIRWGIQTIPLSLSVPIFALIILCLFAYRNQGGKKYFLMTTIFFLLLTILHQFSLFVAATTVILFVAIDSFVLGRIHYRSMNVAILSGLLVFLNFIVTKVGGPRSGQNFFDLIIQLLIADVIFSSPRSGADILSEYSLIQGLGLNAIPGNLGFSIFLLFGVVGGLYWLRFASDSDRLYSVLLIGGTFTLLLSLTLLSSITGYTNLLPWRWKVFYYLFLAILAGPGVWYMLSIGSRGLASNRTIVIALTLCIILPYGYFMVGSPAASNDDPLIWSPTSERKSLTYHELFLLEHTQKYKQDNMEVIIDKGLQGPMDYYGMDYRILTMKYGSPESLFDDGPGLFLYRGYWDSGKTRYFISLKGSEYEIRGRFPLRPVEASGSSVYDNGDDSVYYVA